MILNGFQNITFGRENSLNDVLKKITKQNLSVEKKKKKERVLIVYRSN